MANLVNCPYNGKMGTAVDDIENKAYLRGRGTKLGVCICLSVHSKHIRHLATSCPQLALLTFSVGKIGIPSPLFKNSYFLSLIRCRWTMLSIIGVFCPQHCKKMQGTTRHCHHHLATSELSNFGCNCKTNNWDCLLVHRADLSNIYLLSPRFKAANKTLSSTAYVISCSVKFTSYMSTNVYYEMSAPGSDTIRRLLMSKLLLLYHPLSKIYETR